MICKDKVGLCWPHRVCKKTKWYKKAKCTWNDGFIDFNDKQKRKELIDMGFTCTSPLRKNRP